MTFEQLLYAEVLSHHSSMQKAADTLHITKSGLSMAIGQLENELGIMLFERTARGSRVTSEGLQVLASITAILKSRNTLISIARNINRDGIAETASIRYMNTMFPSFVLPFIDQYESLFSHIRLDISCSQIDNIISDLNNHAIDAGFIGVNSSFDSSLSGLEFAPVCHSKMVLACSRDNPLLRKKLVTPEDLQTQRFCLYSESFQDFLFDRLQFLCGPLKLVMRVDDPWAMHEAIVRLNAVCLGREALGVLSRDNIMDDLCHIDIGNLIDDKVSLGWLTNPKYELSPVKKELIHRITDDITKNAAI